MNGSARGTALVALFIDVPVLLMSTFRVSRGSMRWALPWLGATAFLQYNAVLFLLATPFNSLFLLYVSMFALAFWTLLLVLRAVDVASVANHFASLATARGFALYLGIIAALNAAAWMAGVIPGLFSSSPAFL